ncbi:TPA: hypothetical protein DIS55_01785 [Candidatus Kaiserbacteria bacterium]|nr:hypothetical protein [Candidatus Kaiserbacteria bacterium]
MFDTLRKRLAVRRKQKAREYWAKMTDMKAKGIAEALACEIGMVAAGDFMDEYRRKKAAGMTAVSSPPPSRWWTAVSYALDPTTPEATLFRMIGIALGIIMIAIILVKQALR